MIKLKIFLLDLHLFILFIYLFNFIFLEILFYTERIFCFIAYQIVSENN